MKKLAATIWERADAGGGWIEFQGVHPITRNKVDKMAYVLPSGDDWALVCAINKTDGEAEA